MPVNEKHLIDNDEDAVRVSQRSQSLAIATADAGVDGLRVELSSALTTLSISFGTDAPRRWLDLEIDGHGAVLSRPHIGVTARNITLRNLTIVAGNQETLDLWATGTVLLDNVHLLDQAPMRRNRGAQVASGYFFHPLSPNLRVTLKNSSFLGNQQRGTLSFSQLESGMGTGWVRVEGCRFAGNAGPEISGGAVDVLEVVNTQVMSADGPFSGLAHTLVLSDPTPIPDDPALLAEWRRLALHEPVTAATDAPHSPR